MTEQEIRASLGIPTAAQRVLIFSQSSHMDWDWIETFTRLCDDKTAPYFNRDDMAPAFHILDQAVALVLQNATAKPAYYYSVAEVAFLQAYMESSPARMQNVQKCGAFWHLCGGGMTSPDNLLPHGEAFIRNYLVAKNWLDAKLPGFPVQNIWVPDDFGNDSQLPVAAAAMDFLGVGFARCPGGWAQEQKPIDGSPSLADQLLKNGVDFTWAARDGSTLIAHWMQGKDDDGGYSQGDSIDKYGTDPDKTNAKIMQYLQSNGPSSKTPYIFVPIGSDFRIPKPSLLTYMANWNNGSGPSSYKQTGAYAVAATFDHYVQLLMFHLKEIQPALAFDGVPYWLGHYASRPANKIFHYGATRALLAAEVLSVLAGRANGAALQDAWNILVPSTHHDYITGTSGTSSMDVNACEQLPRLHVANDMAVTECDAAIEQLARSIKTTPPDLYSTPVVVANPLGFPRSGVVSLPAGAGIGAYSSTGRIPVQPNADGSLLFKATVPSFGYSTVYLSTRQAGTGTDAATLSNSGTQWTLSNAFLSATIDSTLAWALRTFVDRKTGANILYNSGGNYLTFYEDGGNVYRYGNEMGGALRPVTTTQSAGTIDVLENGPLRVSVRVTSVASLSGQTYTFVRTYSLVAGEPFLRMSITGSVPNHTALMVTFGLAGGVQSLTRGTAYHWEDKRTVPYWPLPIFYPTHDWLLPIGPKGMLAAVYHDAIPSWGYDAAGNLLGNVLRNTNGGADYGAQANDWGTHTQQYALRVPSGLGAPETGQPLQEALHFSTPMLAAPVAPPPLNTKTMPESASLASVSSPSSAILTVAKSADCTPGDAIFRIYQPANAPQSVVVKTLYDATNAAIQTALESNYVNTVPGAQLTNRAPGTFTVQMKNALATVRLPGVLKR